MDVQLSLSYSTNCMFWLLNEISSVTGSMWCMRNQSNRSTTFISDIFQGILWMNDITIPWHLKMRSTYDLTDAKQKQVVRSLYQPRQSDFCLIILEKWRKIPQIYSNDWHGTCRTLNPKTSVTKMLEEKRQSKLVAHLNDFEYKKF